jgi:hypothetical protein
MFIALNTTTHYPPFGAETKLDWHLSTCISAPNGG